MALKDPRPRVISAGNQLDKQNPAAEGKKRHQTAGDGKSLQARGSDWYRGRDMDRKKKKKMKMERGRVWTLIGLRGERGGGVGASGKVGKVGKVGRWRSRVANAPG